MAENLPSILFHLDDKDNNRNSNYSDNDPETRGSSPSIRQVSSDIPDAAVVNVVPLNLTLKPQQSRLHAKSGQQCSVREDLSASARQCASPKRAADVQDMDGWERPASFESDSSDQHWTPGMKSGATSNKVYN